MSEGLRTLTGGCHCGAVRFEVDVREPLDVDDCNCSICRKTGFLHLIVPERNFRLIQGREKLSEYTFNTGVAKHRFCSICGVKAFYIPRSNPDGIDVNVRCLDESPEMHVSKFDGQNWEKNADALAHKSR